MNPTSVTCFVDDQYIRNAVLSARCNELARIRDTLLQQLDETRTALETARDSSGLTELQDECRRRRVRIEELELELSNLNRDLCVWRELEARYPYHERDEEVFRERNDLIEERKWLREIIAMLVFHAGREVVLSSSFIVAARNLGLHLTPSDLRLDPQTDILLRVEPSLGNGCLREEDLPVIQGIEDKCPKSLGDKLGQLQELVNQQRRELDEAARRKNNTTANLVALLASTTTEQEELAALRSTNSQLQNELSQANARAEAIQVDNNKLDRQLCQHRLLSAALLSHLGERVCLDAHLIKSLRQLGAVVRQTSTRTESREVELHYPPTEDPDTTKHAEYVQKHFKNLRRQRTEHEDTVGELVRLSEENELLSQENQRLLEEQRRACMHQVPITDELELLRADNEWLRQENHRLLEEQQSFVAGRSRQAPQGFIRRLVRACRSCFGLFRKG